MSTSVSHLTDELVLLPVPKRRSLSILPAASTVSGTSPKDALRSLYLSLKPPIPQTTLTDAVQHLQQHELTRALESSQTQTVDVEEKGIYDAVVGKLVAAIYAQTLEIFLNEASEVEAEAEWWADIERSRMRAGYYLLQTLPCRLLALALDVRHALSSQQQHFELSMLSVSSLSQILTRGGHSDSSVIASIFPHLRTHPYVAPFSLVNVKLSALSPRSTQHVLDRLKSIVVGLMSFIPTLLSLPTDLVRQECALKRRALEHIRDERAEVLGTLTSRRDYLAGVLREGEIKGSRLHAFVEGVNQLVVGEGYARSSTDIAPSQLLGTTLHVTLPLHISQHRRRLEQNSLMRPHRIVLLWPRIVLLPPFVLLGLRQIFVSRETLKSFACDSVDTVKKFCQGWLVDPLKDIIKTVRAGEERSVIVQKESIDADLKSLERMAIALARDKLRYSDTQLATFSDRIHKGDLTPILEIYEEDIKSPVKSAVSGTLLRNLFIQIQKAKVDIDQALTGIDKLLKSQELTFAFVGVAPALAIVYVAGGAAAGLWRGGRGQGRYGGKHHRTAAWLAVRRTERLLVSKPTSDDYLSPKGSAIPPLTAGLLLLSVSSLRTYGECHLPLHSRLREGFLDDVGDLENPSLDRDEKVKVIERMWRSWGDVLGWRRGGASIYST
ncbi:ATP synthase regulation protein NCA2-domain-containing protein [Vararia minispora EC-137]|uniref:ATP synthase regulation protein NCA2-domain-containing protein n=1 Tax=Vararia minispora EC-137 TaxID=1314806 RepID=A0ACB8QHB0_9AGAM|nr:ATP synthase regulation protein NCA2-domain-containing protein [Vararia minispora EC-137]